MKAPEKKEYLVFRPDTKEEAGSLTNWQLADTLESEISIMKSKGEGDVYLLLFIEIVKRLRKHPAKCPQISRGPRLPSMADTNTMF